MRSLTINSPVLGWAILIIGILSTASAWRYRHPDTTSDFTLFYVSAQQSTTEMFAHPPGPPRGNMNPPVFQWMLRPLTKVPLPVAAAIWRGLNIASLCVCVWWLVQSSDEKWTMVDYGALLAWAPMASTVALNQLTWILWPLLLWAWWCWRQDRWTAGAIGFGLALTLKPFLGVFILWLLVTRRWRPLLVSLATAGAAFLVGLAAYGVDVTIAWLNALRDVTWAYAGMNASLQGLLTRSMTLPAPLAEPIVVAPALVAPLAAIGGLFFLGVTLARTRRWSIDESWMPLMVGALLASPLGWLYYIWWIIPGTRPSRLFLESPLLWMPMVFPLALRPNGFLTLTLASVYFWGLLGLWVNRLRLTRTEAERSTAAQAGPVVPWPALAVVAVVAVAITGSAVAAQVPVPVKNDPAIGTWVLDPQQSTFDPPQSILSRTLDLEVIGDELKGTVVTDFGTSDGKPDRFEYTGRYNEKDVAIQGGVLSAVSLKRINRLTVERLGKSGSKVVEREVRSLSPDGQRLTLTVYGKNGDVEYSSRQVYKRRS